MTANPTLVKMRGIDEEYRVTDGIDNLRALGVAVEKYKDNTDFVLKDTTQLQFNVFLAVMKGFGYIYFGHRKVFYNPHDKGERWVSFNNAVSIYNMVAKVLGKTNSSIYPIEKVKLQKTKKHNIIAQDMNVKFTNPARESLLDDCPEVS